MTPKRGFPVQPLQNARAFGTKQGDPIWLVKWLRTNAIERIIRIHDKKGEDAIGTVCEEFKVKFGDLHNPICVCCYVHTCI